MRTTFTQRLVFYANLALAVVVAATAVYALPYILSAIYVFRGATELETWLQSNGLTVSAVPLRISLSSIPSSSQSNESRRLAVARESLQWALRLDGRNMKAVMMLVEVYIYQRDFANASQVLYRYASTSQEPGSLARLALAIGDGFAAQGDMPRAKEAWATAGVTVDSRASMELAQRGTVRLNATDFATETDKLYTREADGRVIIRTNGSLNTALLFPTSGNYTVTIHGRNSVPGPVELVVALAGAGLPISFRGNDNSWGDNSLQIPVQAGAHPLSISFINDHFGADGDRNAELAWVEIALH